MTTIVLSATAVLAYLLGSIPTGYIVGRRAVGKDVLRAGSKRTGATNVLRVGGWKAGGVVAVVDLAKGALSVLAARVITGGDPIGDFLAGLFVMLGHNYSAFIRFRGGRGVAVGASATAVMSPITALVAIVLFVAAISLTRHVSLGSILAAVSVPIVMGVLVLVRGQPYPHFLFGVVAAIVVLYSHRDNIARLRDGTERRLGDTTNNGDSSTPDSEP